MAGQPGGRQLKEVGDVGWREEYELLLRKYGLEEDEKEERGSAATWRRQREEQKW